MGIHSTFRSNLLMRVLEPNGGNLYRPHMTYVRLKQYWKCRHGKTGLEPHVIVRCLRCFIGFKLSLIVAKFVEGKCAMCGYGNNHNIICGQFVCDSCFSTMQREREHRKERHG
jgi:hypothetical protein